MSNFIQDTEFILEPKRAPVGGFMKFIDQIVQIDRSTQEVSAADPDDRHSGLLLLVFFIGCAFVVFSTVLVLMWELSWSEKCVKRSKSIDTSEEQA